MNFKSLEQLSKAAAKCHHNLNEAMKNLELAKTGSCNFFIMKESYGVSNNVPLSQSIGITALVLAVEDLKKELDEARTALLDACKAYTAEEFTYDRGQLYN